MSLVKKLATLDRRWIFAFTFVAVLLPLIKPINLPIRVSPEVQWFYDAIEKVPEGSTVYLAADYDPGSLPELQPMLEAAIHQCCKRNLKIIAGSLWPAAPPLVNGALTLIAEGQYGRKPGVDYVNLGFKEGREVVMVQLGQDIRTVYPTDHQGNDVSVMPIMQGIDNYEDLALLINISAGYPGTKEWVQQVRSRYSIAMVAGCTAVSAPEYYPYVQSGQLTGLLGGLAGAAEYEKLVEVPGGSAARKMDAQSLGHVMIIFFIVLGNVIHRLAKRGENA
jgi:hypothetical protein